MATRPTPPGGPQREAQITEGTILFGVYEVLGVLGGGGMGWVYRARHTQLGSLRAIKVIRPDLTANANMEQLFVREARALMQINNDAIVHCHDLLSEDGRVYLVMELVEGPSLEDVLRDGPISTGEVRALMQRVGAGLAAAHALGVIHRDISPGNIILPNGRAEEAKLIDFGVAAVAAAPGQTLVGDFKGKLAYASPEQFGLYGGKVDARSDVYSLGLVLAEAASGVPIPMGQTFYEAVELRKVQPRVPPNVPAELRSEIEPLLRPDPQQRPQSISVRPLASPVPTPAPQPETRQMHWIVPLLYSASAVGVGIGLGFMIWIFRTAGSPPPASIPTNIPVAAPKPISPAPANPAPANPAAAPASTPKVDLRPPPTVKPVVPAVNASTNGSLSRAQVMQTADDLSKFTWVCTEATVAPLVCARQPTSPIGRPTRRWRACPTTGAAPTVPANLNVMRLGLAAGSHKRHGVNRCTTGTDCSGFVAYCWGHQKGGHDFSTANFDALSDRLNGNVYRDLKPGDALNKPGSHIVLFAGYRPDGGPIVYEASGAAGRVIRNDHGSWSRLAGYYPVRSNRLIDP